MSARKVKLEPGQAAEYQYEGKRVLILGKFLASLNLIFYIYLLM